MRRRALCAASAASGGDVSGGFTADFYFDYCENWGLTTICERAADELGVVCYNEMVRLIELYGERANEYHIILHNPQQYGFTVTLEGSDVISISKEYNAYFLTTYGEYGYTKVFPNGALYYEL